MRRSTAPVLPKPQKRPDLAFLSLSLLTGVSLPNLYPGGIGVPFIGPEIFTLPSALVNFSGDAALSFAGLFTELGDLAGWNEPLLGRAVNGCCNVADDGAGETVA